ncbi:MAG: alanine--tRNA ligase, partial [Desulfobacterales bacterium]
RVFLGEEKRGYIRATTSQKCVRAGGKHNDLENVGYTARHHTFFEMLGNFSFGDYFKEKAIELGWDLLVNGYGLPAEKLWVSVYLDDDEAHDIWHRQIGVPTDRILRLGEADNFWAMGDTGPCGPCSEIHLDRGEAHGCGQTDCGVECECDRYLEIWNLVFMQFNRDESGTMTPLPKPSIDTGMGLERLVSVLQNVATNFDTDLILPIIKRTEELSGKGLGSSRETDVALKVIADHSRAAAFLIGDGVLPANEGRGYVLRRIMRRAIRYGRNLGLTRPFLYDTARVVMDIMRPAYPELAEADAFITRVIENEEQRFFETLDNGLRLLNDTIADLKAKGADEVPGSVIFKLYDTFGFPVDIVTDVLRDEKMSLDMAGFDTAMAAQREQSRSVAAFSGISDSYRQLTSQGVKTDFTGYEALTSDERVMLIVRDGESVDAAAAGDAVEVVCGSTPFYGAAGGQVGDRGTMIGTGGSDFLIDVLDTVKDPTGLVIHKGSVVRGTVRRGDTVSLKVDADARRATALNHTATHILHAELRAVLGDHVKQAGSLVSPDRLRFDFTHFSQVSPEELMEIETKVNDRIRTNVSTHTDVMDLDHAMQSGATALFEEKYGDQVRVVSLADFSKELCGGTHTRQTGDIGLFKIVSESSIASGVRRIEAVTGAAAVARIQENDALIHTAARMLKESPDGLVARLEKIMALQKALEKDNEKLKAALAVKAAGANDDEIRSVNGIRVIARRVEVDSPGQLRNLIDRFKDKLGSGIVVLGCVSEGKALLAVGVTKDLTDRCNAGAIIRDVAAVVGGGGGGRADMAQAGGSRPENLDQAIEKAYDVIGRQ